MLMWNQHITVKRIWIKMILNIDIDIYTLVDNFNDRTISKKDFCEIFLDRIRPFRDGNGRTC